MQRYRRGSPQSGCRSGEEKESLRNGRRSGTFDGRWLAAAAPGADREEEKSGAQLYN
jgi:hypothetical protein